MNRHITPDLLAILVRDNPWLEAPERLGHVVNLTEWSSALGIDRRTVEKYLEILESSHVLVRVSPFVGGGRAEITSRPKIFFVDPGIRHRLIHEFRPLGERVDRGAVLENWVFTEIWKRTAFDETVHFWRSSSGAEVDFVLVRGDHLVAVEVQSAALGRPKLPRSARSFADAYEPARLLVVNTGLRHAEEVGRTTVRWLLPQDLPPAIA